jgi:sialate O-acetylesterase
MKLAHTSLLLLVMAGISSAAHAAVVPNPLFADHAVLQRGISVPVWGQASPGEAVTVKIAGQTVRGEANADGKWTVRLAPMKAGGPFTLTISGENTRVLDDILVGEVWVASGQSNMERQLGPRIGQQPIDKWEEEVAAAKYPQIRQFGVVLAQSLTPLATVEGKWVVCSPDTVKDFTAVGYFFARDLYRAKKVPIGIIHSSRGGTPAEAWTNEIGLRQLPDFAALSQKLKMAVENPEAARRDYEAQLDAWFSANDAGSQRGHAWNKRKLDTKGWDSMSLPTLWEDAGIPALKDFNGVVWFRKTFDLPANAASHPATLDLGMVDDIDTTFVNGVQVGTTTGYNLVREYAVPASVLKPGRNVVAVRVLDTGGGGGIWGERKPQLRWRGKSARTPIDLSGPWQYRVGMNMLAAPLPPANFSKEKQYRRLFPAMISGWRQAWGQGNFPFLFVQIAPHREMSPEIREAQLLTWQHTPNTAMAVITDCGDAADIHPPRKQPVGARLALAARALAYGEKIEYAGPTFASMKIEGRKAILRFTHLGGGLTSKAGPLRGFTVAGADGVFHPDKATIAGKTVLVSSEDVAEPVAVRYGWAPVPEGNLFNQAGLPASPFRTDVDDVD